MAKDDLTADQAIGHLLQNLLALFNRQIDFEQHLRHFEQPHAENARHRTA